MSDAVKVSELEKLLSELKAENERLQAQLENDMEILSRNEQQLKLSYLATVQALVRAIEIKDPYTVGHSELVSKYAAACAAKMGYNEEDSERVKIAGMLLDIGKIGVSQEILLKPGPLSDAEQQIVETHPKFGAEILEPLVHPFDVSEIVFQHHERMDGTGYPLKIKSDQINMEARILGVADSFVAMKTKRAWREAYDVADIRAYLKGQAGKKFDSQVVDVFFQVIDAGPEEIERELANLAKTPSK